MSIDPNKAFGMKACNKAYTLEFKRDGINGTTEISATDAETSRMSFGQRFNAAWRILTGKTSIGEMVFPIRLRNSDFYHMSYIYRPEKKAENVVETKVTKTPAEGKKPATEKAAKAPSATAKKPRKPKTVTSETTETAAQ